MSEAVLQDLDLKAGAAIAEGPEWLEPLRRAAAARFAAVGFPASRDEEWRFTPVTPIAQRTWRPAAAEPAGLHQEQLAPFVFGHPEWSTLVFVDGVFSESLSRVAAVPGDVRVGSLAEALRSGDDLLPRHLARHAPVEGSPFTALNTAGFRDGGLLYVPAGVDLERPVHFVFVTTTAADGVATHPRNLIVVERAAAEDVQIEFPEYFRIGLPLTLATLLLGSVWLWISL